MRNYSYISEHIENKIKNLKIVVLFLNMPVTRARIKQLFKNFVSSH